MLDAVTIVYDLISPTSEAAGAYLTLRNSISTGIFESTLKKSGFNDVIVNTAPLAVVFISPTSQPTSKVIVSSSNNSKSVDNTGAIVGGVLGTLLGVVLIAFMVYMWRRNKDGFEAAPERPQGSVEDFRDAELI